MDAEKGGVKWIIYCKCQDAEAVRDGLVDVIRNNKEEETDEKRIGDRSGFWRTV